MEVLVLGGNGFIGSHVVDALRVAGHSVRIFGRGPDRWRPPLADVEYFSGEFSDTVLLASALDGVDAVVHLISTTVPSTSNQDPIFDIQSNLVNTVRLLQLMREQDISRIVYFSSGGTVYGIPDRLPVEEAAPLNPICSYGAVKVASERYLATFEHLYDLRPTILRPSNPYGPRQGRHGVQGVVSTFIRRILDGDPITIWGSGNIIRDFICVADLADLCCLAVEADKTGTFNVGSGKGWTLNELVAAIEQATDKKARIEFEDARRFDVPGIVLDIDRASAVFGWTPAIPIGEGLSRLRDWMCGISGK